MKSGATGENVTIFGAMSHEITSMGNPNILNINTANFNDQKNKSQLKVPNFKELETQKKHAQS